MGKELNGDCPKCEKSTLETYEYDYPDGKHIVTMAHCSNCDCTVSETYKLIKQEVIEQ